MRLCVKTQSLDARLTGVEDHNPVDALPRLRPFYRRDQGNARVGVFVYRGVSTRSVFPQPGISLTVIDRSVGANSPAPVETSSIECSA